MSALQRILTRSYSIKQVHAPDAELAASLLVPSGLHTSHAATRAQQIHGRLVVREHGIRLDRRHRLHGCCHRSLSLLWRSRRRRDARSRNFRRYSRDCRRFFRERSILRWSSHCGHSRSRELHDRNHATNCSKDECDSNRESREAPLSLRRLHLLPVLIRLLLPDRAVRCRAAHFADGRNVPTCQTHLNRLFACFRGRLKRFAPLGLNLLWCCQRHARVRIRARAFQRFAIPTNLARVQFQNGNGQDLLLRSRSYQPESKQVIASLQIERISLLLMWFRDSRICGCHVSLELRQ